MKTLKLFDDFDKKTIYVYRIEYENNLIHTLEFFKYSRKQRKFIPCKCNIHTIGYSLFNNEFKAVVGRINNDIVYDCVEITPFYKGNLWWVTIKGSTDQIDLLKYATNLKIEYSVSLLNCYL